MSRSEEERFADILDAIQRCQEYAQYLRSMTSRRWRTTLCCATSPSSVKRSERCQARLERPWRTFRGQSIAGLRNIVVHEYFRVNPDLILDIVNHQLAPLADRLRDL